MLEEDYFKQVLRLYTSVVGNGTSAFLLSASAKGGRAEAEPLHALLSWL
jgi:hypothetical protein